MGKIVSELFSSLDGVVSSPDKWHGRYFTPEMGEQTEEALASAAVMLLGRNTYLEHAGFWPTAQGRMAELMNAIPKLVVTSTLGDVEWRNSSVLAVDEVADRKAGLDGDILVTGSVALVQSLLRAGLVDELRLIVDPLVLGEGTRLFAGTGDLLLRLVDTRRYDSGAIALTYASAGG
jgi:dihydrofolate reductase